MPISLPLLYACNWRSSAEIFLSDSWNPLTLTKYVFFFLPRKFTFYCKKRKSYVKVLSKGTYRLRKSSRILVDPSLVNCNTNRASTEAAHFPVERISVFYHTVTTHIAVIFFDNPHVLNVSESTTISSQHHDVSINKPRVSSTGRTQSRLDERHRCSLNLSRYPRYFLDSNASTLRFTFQVIRHFRHVHVRIQVRSVSYSITSHSVLWKTRESR